jgi:hypothetical protein
MECEHDFSVDSIHGLVRCSCALVGQQGPQVSSALDGRRSPGIAVMSTSGELHAVVPPCLFAGDVTVVNIG